MKLLYLDAAGDPGFPPPFGKSTSMHYVLAGLSIDAKDWAIGNEKLLEIKRNYFPNIEDSQIELKYSSLFNKIKPFDSLSGEQRKELADEIFDLILNLKPVLFAVVIDKLEHRKKYVSAEKPNILAIRYMVPRFSMYLKRISDHGVMIYDSEEMHINKELRDFLLESRKTGVVLPHARIRSPLSVQNRLYNIIETIFFIESHVSPIMQLVDFCAGTVFLKYERGKTDRFDQINNLFDSSQGKIYGLYEWP